MQYDNKKSNGRKRNEQKDKKRSIGFPHFLVNALSSTNLPMKTFLVHSFLSDIFGSEYMQSVMN